MNKSIDDPKKFSVVSAYTNQGGNIYQNADLWVGTTIKKNTVLVQMDYKNRFEPSKSGNKDTAGHFFTTLEELEKHVDTYSGKVDTASLSEAVQVKAQLNLVNNQYRHYGGVMVYKTTKDITAAAAQAVDNVPFGKGGADQYFIEASQTDMIEQDRLVEQNGIKKLTKVGFLKPVQYLEAKSITPRHEIYNLITEAEKAGVPQAEKNIITRLNNEYKQHLYKSGDKNALDKVEGIEERAKFTQTAKDIIINADWQALKDVVTPEPRTQLEKLAFSRNASFDPVRRTKIAKLIEQVKTSQTPISLRDPDKHNQLVTNSPKSRSVTIKEAQSLLKDNSQAAKKIFEQDLATAKQSGVSENITRAEKRLNGLELAPSLLNKLRQEGVSTLNLTVPQTKTPVEAVNSVIHASGQALKQKGLNIARPSQTPTRGR